MKPSETGLTLIEMMIALIVFSSAIGMVSNIVKKGVERPFVVGGVEPWLRLIEDSNRAILDLPVGFDPDAVNVTTPPLNHIPKPSDLRSWELDWHLSSITGIRVAAFSATNSMGKSFQWKIYKLLDE